MATGPVHGVLHHVRRAVLREQDAARTDGELLTRFLARRDEAAFAALVRRCGPMVYGVCRRLLGSADADDAFQAVFLVLVRKAAAVRPRERVANWLYGVAYHTAQKARAAAARRRANERTAAAMRRPDASDDIWGPLLPILDEELRRLPENYRLPIVLCELEGRTHQEAARQLGWPVGTVSGRLSRGRALLARRMRRRGAAPPDLAPAGVPPALAAATAKAATAFAAGSAAAVSAKVLALAEGATRVMLLTKLRRITAALLTAALLTGAGAAVAFGPMPGKPGPTAASPDAADAPRADKAPEPAPSDPDEKAIREYVAELRAAAKDLSDGNLAVLRVSSKPMFRKAVLWAAKRGDDALAVELLRDRFGPMFPANPDATALTWAAWFDGESGRHALEQTVQREPEIAKVLLDKGADPNVRCASSETALMLAAAAGQAEIVRLLLEKKAEVNARCDRGDTALMYAAASDDPEAVRLLLAAQADVNARNRDGQTALMFAAERARLENARLLLSEGADVRVRDKKGRTAADLVRPPPAIQGPDKPEQAKQQEEQAKRDAEALRRILERAGGGD
jgi:RNA polymerase sigma factor (sigma-70 family)